jgi:rare lipoprotein A (peptidoglycan hydrolase)
LVKHRLAIAIYFSALLAYGQQPGDDKPSPVPRRPLRPQSAQVQDRAVPAGRSAASAERVASGANRETGTACFFSAAADGGLTASGTRLNSQEMVAGHASFPLGSWVRVRNLANGNTVDVRIVDRFPPSSRRVINLSQAAAEILGIIKAGTGQVELTLLESPG